jgi:murein DD-endopeptidase MepM/ murein hydrolase activator NlpD
MSSAKRTPRYVEQIPPRNLRIVGPTVEAQVIPIRRITPAYVPVVDAPVPAPPAAPSRRRRKAKPVGRRPWRVMIVSQVPGAPTRSFGVARWQARFVVAALSFVFLIAGGAVAAFVFALQSPDLLVTSADVALLNDQLLDSQDSLALLRAELLDAQAAASDSAIALAASHIVAGEKPAPRMTHKYVAPTPRVTAVDRIALSPRTLEALPVLGRISSTFSLSRRHPILHIRRPHLGVDIAAPRGTHITAPAPGRVTFVGHKFGFGLVVEIQHSSAVKTRYAHMRAAVVKEGDRVARGDQIGTVGSSGITTGPHLHYEVLVRGKQVDPLRFVLPQSAAPESPVPAAAAPSAARAVVPDEGGAAAPDSSTQARVEQDSTAGAPEGIARH